MANAVGSAVAVAVAGDGGGVSGRGLRLPRWTRQEILVLIEGKRVVESGGGRGRGGEAAAPLPLVGEGRRVEPKWVSVAAYCRRHGVDRGAVHCRKRWSNLAGDYKKIKEWELGRGNAAGESFWTMRNDARRERRLPGFFDREVYDILDGGEAVAVEAEAGKAVEVIGTERRAAVAEDEAVFDSGRSAGCEGLFSDSEDDNEAKEEEEVPPVPPATASIPILEEESEPTHQEHSDHLGVGKDKQPADKSEKATPCSEKYKRRRTSHEGPGDTNLQTQLIEMLEKNSKVLTAQLEAQNVNYQLDRDQRKDHADSLLGVLSKLADALGRIADKL